MLDILFQETDYEHGNDCLIKNCYLMFECHSIFVVLNIRRYIGWCDDGLHFIGKKEFDNHFDAYDYFLNNLRTM